MTSGCEWQHAPEARTEDFGRFEKRSWVLPREKTVDFRLLAEALGRCHTSWGGRWKSQNRKNVYLSPYVKEPLNSKVIKSFVPELRSKCFSCFEIPMFYVYMLWTVYVRFTKPYLAMVHFEVKPFVSILSDRVLVGWVLWFSNLRRLFNAKSIFMKIDLFQAIQFSIISQFECKNSLIVKTFLLQAIQFCQAVLIQLIQFSISTGFVYTQLMSKQFYIKQFSLV